MSASMSVSKSVVLSEKFKKEVEKFFEWMDKCGYIIKDINDNEQVWSLNLLNKFDEPGRNKLEAYIKVLFSKYTITYNEMDIEDAKLLAKEFKEKGQDMKSNKKVDKKNNKKKDEKVDDKKCVSMVEENVKLNMLLDTSECYNVDTLEYWTSELIEVFGEPEKTGGEDMEHTWEWKIEVNGVPYTIYNWNEDNEPFDNMTWYLGAISDDEKNIKVLIDYINSWFYDESIETKKVIMNNNVEVKENVKSSIKINMDELFGDSDDELSLNDIEDE